MELSQTSKEFLAVVVFLIDFSLLFVVPGVYYFKKYRDSRREGLSVLNPLFWTVVVTVVCYWGVSMINYFVSVAIREDITQIIRQVFSS